ncbi:hypothetical protein CCZ01_02030 [Helicobacter monodelphidis]|uniref:Cj0814 family flagellar-dependent secreted protein n=1 Tax=Helicobacter sp. 15-1451 TaxID=2004995 RepID=UPI000DCB4D2C|nr:hypothetical protein [Helicobacter sp. 15-1451]RAX58586.1 hypothetical protein CCZ01_02030 [Helicobacter sp. 15-1451]
MTRQYDSFLSNDQEQWNGFHLNPEGYLLGTFNQMANLPADFHLHYKSLQSFISTLTGCHTNSTLFPPFKKINLLKSIQNTHIVFQQVLGDSIKKFLSHNIPASAFKSFPYGYAINRQTLEVTRIYKTHTEFQDANSHIDFKHNIALRATFFTKGILQSKYIFSSLYGKYHAEDDGFSWNPHGEYYLHPDESISKGGIFIAFMREAFGIEEGEATYRGKLSGMDRHIDSAKLQQLWENDQHIMQQIAKDGLFEFNTNLVSQDIADHIHKMRQMHSAFQYKHLKYSRNVNKLQEEHQKASRFK